MVASRDRQQRIDRKGTAKRSGGEHRELQLATASMERLAMDGGTLKLVTKPYIGLVADAQESEKKARTNQSKASS